MNNFSALDTRVSAEKKEPNWFQIRFISRPQYILNENIFYKSECIFYRSSDELYCFAWRTLSCYQLSFWTEQIVILTMETFLQMGQTRGNIYRENTTKLRFIKWNIFLTKNLNYLKRVQVRTCLHLSSSKHSINCLETYICFYTCQLFLID